jgi:hypothetical protein
MRSQGGVKSHPPLVFLTAGRKNPAVLRTEMIFAPATHGANAPYLCSLPSGREVGAVRLPSGYSHSASSVLPFGQAVMFLAPLSPESRRLSRHGLIRHNPVPIRPERTRKTHARGYPLVRQETATLSTDLRGQMSSYVLSKKWDINGTFGFLSGSSGL